MDVGFVGMDLDGTLLDTDSDKHGSPKYLESLEIIREMTKNQAPDISRFNGFFDEFARQSEELSMRLSSKVFAELMQKHYNIPVSLQEFGNYRISMREKTYAESVRFIGENGNNSGNWLAELPSEIQNKLVLVTSVSKEALPYIAANPQLKIAGRTLDDFFGNRIVFGDKVLCTGEPILHRKPSPEPYEKAMALTSHVSERGLVGIAFEDGKKGIISAKNARYNNGRLFVVGIGTSLSEAQAGEEGAKYFAATLCAVKLPDLLDAYMRAK
ncbi:MAG: hypothetical protein V1702_05055 [Candidatus Woesearchaeota archaeon]